MSILARCFSTGHLESSNTSQSRQQNCSRCETPLLQRSSKALIKHTVLNPSGVPASSSAAVVPLASRLRLLAAEVASLYKGVLGAATGTGIIIGAYFAFYSSTKQLLRENTALPEGEEGLKEMYLVGNRKRIAWGSLSLRLRVHQRSGLLSSTGSIAFVSGATAAVGSSVIKVRLLLSWLSLFRHSHSPSHPMYSIFPCYICFKVPIAVCVRSVQAGVYQVRIRVWI